MSGEAGIGSIEGCRLWRTGDAVSFAPCDDSNADPVKGS
jgi:hypothetical protein